MKRALLLLTLFTFLHIEAYHPNDDEVAERERNSRNLYEKNRMRLQERTEREMDYNNYYPNDYNYYDPELNSNFNYPFRPRPQPSPYDPY